MKVVYPLLLILCLIFEHSEARIVNRKVKEAPKTCKVMEEDNLLSRKEKMVLGTLRHSVLIEDDAKNITLVKDKGEKICQWSFDQWAGIQSDNKLPDLKTFKFYIDEYKNVIYPYVKKGDQSYFVMSVPIETCDLSDQVTRAELELPKCEIPRKMKRKSFRNKSRRLASSR